MVALDALHMHPAVPSRSEDLGDAALVAKGLTFEATDKEAFRKALSAAGFYKEWRGKFGEDGWKVLEGVVGALA